MKNTTQRNEGFTLVEVAISMGIFALVISAAAQSLISFSATMQIQDQRNEAIVHCRAILAQIRRDRDNSALPFPQQVLQAWPNGSQSQDPALVRLTNEVINVAYEDVAADPLQVTVTSAWTDMQGRVVQVSLSSLITGENR